MSRPFTAIAILVCLSGEPPLLAAAPMPAPVKLPSPALVRAFRHTERALERLSAALGSLHIAAPLPAPTVLPPPQTLPVGPPPSTAPFPLSLPPVTSGPTSVLPPQTFGGGGGTVGPPIGGSFGSPPPLGGSFGGGRPRGGSFGNGRP